MGNFAMTIWNSTCNPCFSTFDQIFVLFHGLKTGFFCYSLKLDFICYPNRFFTHDYSLWDGWRHTFLWTKTNFNYICFSEKQSSRGNSRPSSSHSGIIDLPDVSKERPRTSSNSRKVDGTKNLKETIIFGWGSSAWCLFHIYCINLDYLTNLW